MKKNNKDLCSKVHPQMLAVVRIVVGILFALHGASKFGLIGDGNIAGFAGFAGIPVWLAVLVGVTELGGGLLLAVGAFTKIVTIPMAIVMVVAYGMAHIPQGWNPLGNGGVAALLFLGLFVIYHVQGSGVWSVDKVLTK
ncbi:MAG: DoxX family protein [Candidatus Woesearchaeota archaeon]